MDTAETSSTEREVRVALASAGLATIICGQAIAWWARGAFTTGDSPVFPVAAVVLGLALLVGARLGRPWRWQVQPALVAIYAVGYLIPITAMAMVAPVELVTDWTYTLFILVVAAVLSHTPLADLRQTPLWVMILGTIASALPIYELATRPRLEAFVRLTVEGNNNTLAIASCAGITIVGAVMTLTTNRSRTPIIGLACALSCAISLACVVLSNTRSVMLALLYTLPIYFALRSRMSPEARRPASSAARRAQVGVFLTLALGGLAAAPIAAVAALGTETVASFAKVGAERFTGAFNLFESDPNGVVDRSSQERVDTIERTLSGIDILGHGVNAQLLSEGNLLGVGVYPHLTYLQALYDLGLLGGILFAILHFSLPVAIIALRWRAGNLGRGETFVILFFLFSHIDHLTHATPYFWLATFPVLVVYVLVPRNSMPVSAAEVPLYLKSKTV